MSILFNEQPPPLAKQQFIGDAEAIAAILPDCFDIRAAARDRTTYFGWMCLDIVGMICHYYLPFDVAIYRTKVHQRIKYEQSRHSYFNEPAIKTVLYNSERNTVDISIKYVSDEDQLNEHQWMPISRDEYQRSFSSCSQGQQLPPSNSYDQQSAASCGQDQQFPPPNSYDQQSSASCGRCQLSPSSYSFYRRNPLYADLTTFNDLWTRFRKFARMAEFQLGWDPRMFCSAELICCSSTYRSSNICGVGSRHVTRHGKHCYNLPRQPLYYLASGVYRRRVVVYQQLDASGIRTDYMKLFYNQYLLGVMRKWLIIGELRHDDGFIVLVVEPGNPKPLHEFCLTSPHWYFISNYGMCFIYPTEIIAINLAQ